MEIKDLSIVEDIKKYGETTWEEGFNTACDEILKLFNTNDSRGQIYDQIKEMRKTKQED